MKHASHCFRLRLLPNSMHMGKKECSGLDSVGCQAIADGEIQSNIDVADDIQKIVDVELNEKNNTIVSDDVCAHVCPNDNKETQAVADLSQEKENEQVCDVEIKLDEIDKIIGKDFDDCQTEIDTDICVKELEVSLHEDGLECEQAVLLEKEEVDDSTIPLECFDEYLVSVVTTSFVKESESQNVAAIEQVHEENTLDEKKEIESGVALFVEEKKLVCEQESVSCVQDAVVVAQESEIEVPVRALEENVIEGQKPRQCAKQGVIFLGRVYNHGLVDPTTNRWVMNLSLAYNFAHCGYNAAGCEIPLGKWLFDDFKVKDVFLLSKLSDEDKICFTPDCVPLPIAANVRENQYLAYIANFNVGICAAERQSIKADIGVIYNFWFKDNYKLRCSVGFDLPIISRSHIMNFGFEGPKNNKETGFNKEQMKNAMDEFHKRFDGMSDFFSRAVLDPKCLCWCERQRKIGFGDLFCFALLDLASYVYSLDGLQLSAEITLPTSKKTCWDTIWPIKLGFNGACRFGVSAKMFYKSPLPYFNPLLGIRGRFFTSTKCKRRVPRLIMNDDKERVVAEDIDCLIAPLDLIAFDYEKVYIAPFKLFDSCIANFSDRAFCTSTRFGNIFELDIGNYFYNVFRVPNFNANIFYEFTYQGCDRVCVLEKGNYNTCLLEKNTNSRLHRLSWSLDYMFNNGDCDISFGSTHVIGGINVRKVHEINVSLTALF